jgi:FAD/FMN-containing dehydrogenase
MEIDYLSTRSAAFYYYAPVAKFAEIYDLWENICRKYGYWNEKYIPAWLSWADRNSINPYPMIVAIPSLDPEELKKFKAFWTEHCSKLIEKGCAMYAIGRTIPREALTNLGNGYKLLKTIKRAMDPNNIMNPGILF